MRYLLSIVLLFNISYSCSPQEIIDLRKAGYTKSEIEEICSKEEQKQIFNKNKVPNFNPVAYGSKCQTPFGICMMAVPGVLNSVCYCPNQVTRQYDMGKIIR